MPSYFLIGFSLGGNVVVRYAGLHGSDLESRNICGAMSVSQGYDALKGVRNLAAMPFWNFGITGKLKSLLKRHADIFKDIVDVEHILQSTRNVEDFDNLFTCKIYGFANAELYYREHSCIYHLQNVKVPLLLINSIDDPIVPPFLVPHESPKNNPNIILVTTKYGGHLGFAEGFFFPKATHWHERVALQFIRAVIKLKSQ